MKDWNQCCNEVANKHGFDSIDKGFNAVPINKLYKQASELYAKEVAIESVKLAREKAPLEEGAVFAMLKYTEEQIIKELKL